MKKIATVLSLLLTASVAFAADAVELNRLAAGDVARAMKSVEISVPKAASKYIVLSPVLGAYVTLDAGANRMWITDTNAAGIGETYSWSAGREACENLNYAGFSDWRLPTDKELVSLVDKRFTAPSIDQKFFPDTSIGYYWTGTNYPENSFIPRVWTVSFNKGGVYYAATIGNSYYIRCVRPGNLQPPQM